MELKRIDDNKMKWIEIFFDTNGLNFVRATFRSKSISIMSLIIQPALLIKKEPIKKRKYQNNSFEVSIFSNAKPNQQGHINKRKPMGLLNLINSK